MIETVKKWLSCCIKEELKTSINSKSWLFVVNNSFDKQIIRLIHLFVLQSAPCWSLQRMQLWALLHRLYFWNSFCLSKTQINKLLIPNALSSSRSKAGNLSNTWAVRGVLSQRRLKEGFRLGAVLPARAEDVVAAGSCWGPDNKPD